jgi:hypothetical protein
MKMNRTSRRVAMGLLVAGGFSVMGLVGCSGSGGNDDGSSRALGEMALPLTAQGASGLSYRLRDATFVVQSQYYGGSAGHGGSAGPSVIVVSSETDPNAKNITLSLEEGYYNVSLQPGWRMEKFTAYPGQPEKAETVEATLLSGSSQWVWVSRQSTSWAEFSFGIGGREVWLNGKLNIGIDVQEGAAGAGGAPDIGVGGYGGDDWPGSAGEGGAASFNR